jgi:hypothetical protein
LQTAALQPVPHLMRGPNHLAECHALAWVEIEDQSVGVRRVRFRGAPWMQLNGRHLRQRDEALRVIRAFAELLSQEQPEKYVPTLSKTERRGRILIDWLRNGIGATAVASFCPRARPGATVATPLGWDEVTANLIPTRFTIRSVPERLARLRKDRWEGFDEVAQTLPEISAGTASPAPRQRKAGTGRGAWSTRLHPNAESDYLFFAERLALRISVGA